MITKYVYKKPHAFYREEQFKKYFNIFLAYALRFRKTDRELEQNGLLQQVKTHYIWLFEWIGVIFGYKPPFDQLYTFSYEELREFYGLTMESYTPNAISIDIWGPNYWYFLHYGSICTQIHYEETNDEHFMKIYSAMLRTFYLSLLCPECASHYSKLKLWNDRSLSHDAIRQLFDLHNMVNVETNKESMPWTAFLEKYSLGEPLPMPPKVLDEGDLQRLTPPKVLGEGDLQKLAPKQKSSRVRRNSPFAPKNITLFETETAPKKLKLFEPLEVTL